MSNSIVSLMKKAIAFLSFLILPVLFYEQVVFVCAALVQALASASHQPFLSGNLPLLYTSTAAAVSGLILLPVYFYLKKKSSASEIIDPGASVHHDPAPELSRKAPVFSARSYIFPALFGASGAVFFNLLLAFSRLPELFPTVSTLEPAAVQSSVLLGALVTCLITPLIEELVFRGYGFFLLRREFGFPGAALLSAAAFGLFHGDVSQSLYGFCMGLLLAHTAEQYRSLHACILFHICANVTSFFLLTDLSRERLIISMPVLGLSGILCAWSYHKIKEVGKIEKTD